MEPDAWWRLRRAAAEEAFASEDPYEVAAVLGEMIDALTDGPPHDPEIALATIPHLSRATAAAESSDLRSARDEYEQALPGLP